MPIAVEKISLAIGTLLEIVFSRCQQWQKNATFPQVCFIKKLLLVPIGTSRKDLDFFYLEASEQVSKKKLLVTNRPGSKNYPMY
jgi:hypothetical protein